MDLATEEKYNTYLQVRLRKRLAEKQIEINNTPRREYMLRERLFLERIDLIRMYERLDKTLIRRYRKQNVVYMMRPRDSTTISLY